MCVEFVLTEYLHLFTIYECYSSESLLCGNFNSVKPLQRAVPVELLAQVPVCLVSCEIRVKRPTFPIQVANCYSCFITLKVRPV
jgi:hypothetical protein